MTVWLVMSLPKIPYKHGIYIHINIWFCRPYTCCKRTLPKIPYIHRIYMVLAKPTYCIMCSTRPLGSGENQLEFIPKAIGEAGSTLESSSADLATLLP